MADADSLLDSGRSVAAEHPALAAVPLVVSLLAVEKVQRVAGFRGGHFGISFPTPSPVIDLWTFVSVPQTGVSGPAEVPLLALPVYVAVRGVLAAGYLGSIHDALAGRSLAFGENVSRYGVPLVGYEVLQVGAVLALVPLAALSPVLVVPAALAVFVVGYLFYGTPYLVVVDDEGLVDALGHSYRLAVGGGRYAVFFVALLVGGAVLSVVATAVVANLGLPGVLLGAVLVAPLAVAVNAAAVALFVEIGGSSPPSAGHVRDDRPGDT